MRTSFENVPPEWLRHVEPYVQRGAYLPCWIWTGQVDSKGYPIITETYRGKRSEIKVHRMVAKIFFDFPKSYTVRRSCNVRNCVNPNHLRVAAQQ
jgi:hypothetical protein